MPVDAGIAPRDLITWHAERFGPLKTGLDGHAAARGFASNSDFLVAMTRARIAEMARDRSRG
jgi:hypothetical protein